MIARRYYALVFGLGILLMASPLTTLAQASQEPNSPGERELEAIANYLTGRGACLDIYRLGSVHLNFTEETISQSFAPGESVTIRGSLKNTNSFPLTGGRLLARVLRQDASVAANHWHPVITETDVPGNFSLAAQGSRDFSFTWSVPKGAPNSLYRVEFSYLAGGRYSMSGLSFVPNFTGGSVVFSVANSSAPAYLNFDRSSVRLNDAALALRSVPPVLEPDTPVKISANLTLPQGQTSPVTVTAALYNWSDSDAKPPIQTSTVQHTLSPGSSVPVTLVWESSTAGVYEAVFTAQAAIAGTLPSILKVRFPIAGNSPRIIFSGVTNITNGQATITSCVLNGTYSQPTISGGPASSRSGSTADLGSGPTLSPTPSAAAGGQLGQSSTVGAPLGQGTSTVLATATSAGQTLVSAESAHQAGQLSTLTAQFPLDQVSGDLDLATIVKTAAGTTADEHTIKYAVADLRPTLTPESPWAVLASGPTKIAAVIVVIIIVLLLITGKVMWRRRQKSQPPPTAPPTVSSLNTGP